jgi:hypothetical protein
VSDVEVVADAMHAAHQPHGADQRVVLVRRNGAAEHHDPAAGDNLHVARPLNDAAERGAYPSLDGLVVGVAVGDETSSFGDHTLKAVRQVARAKLDAVERLVREAVALVAQDCAAAASEARVEVVHARRAERPHQ